MPKLAIGLRVYEKNQEALIKKMRFLRHVPWNLVEKVFVAVNVEKDQSEALQYFNVVLADPRVEAFPVQPWFKIGLPALNAMVHKAAAEQFDYLWFVSTRLILNEKIAKTLLQYIVENPGDSSSSRPSVVGAEMPGHGFEEEDWEPREEEVENYEVNGETVPYNTCAIWHLPYLYPIGFLSIGEMPRDPEMAGVEEMATIKLQGALFDTHARVLKIQEIQEQTSHWDEERKERHEKIISSKTERSARQGKLLDPFDRHTHASFIQYINPAK